LYEKIKKLKLDGIIAREPSDPQALIDLQIPLIVSPNKIDNKTPAILTDSKEIGCLAAQHLIDRGFRNFAYCGYHDKEWSQNRCKSFCEHLKQAKFKPVVFQESVTQDGYYWEREQKNIVNWLKSLPKPIGMMACNDDMARLVLESCRITGYHVPGDIAVIGCDNDELTCDLTDPPLSSIELNPAQSGYQAAELLTNLMKGTPANGQIIKELPSHVEIRQSTDIWAIDDRQVLEALAFIKKNYSRPLQVNDVAEAVAMSKRNLYDRFQKALGRTISQEIRRVRIAQIELLLRETNLSISQIAKKTGFGGVEHIARYFKREKGISPLVFRRNIYKKISYQYLILGLLILLF
jgi:LacI family transcriptional regulator